MDEINALQNIDFFEVFVGLVTIIVVFNFLYKNIVENIIQKFGIETRGMRKRREEHDLLIKTAENLVELQKKHNEDNDECVKHDNEIKEDLKKLTEMFIDKEIDDMRYKILDFASSLSSGKKFNRESYDHILRIYGKYEQILEEYNLENGLVEESIKYVQNSYQEYLKNGVINY